MTVLKSNLGLIALALLFITSGCASSLEREICQESDWYELGRREGANGEPLALTEKVEPRCPQTDLNLSQDLYRNGHYKGLLEYCSPENGFELGKSGHSYHKVCPHDIEPSFLKRYQAGRRFFQLERDNKLIDEKIETLFRELNQGKIDIIKQGSLRAELDTLQKVRAQNDRRLTELEKRQIN